ncbi:type II toxin-antitoxin system VapC family toxin [Tautonia marina]|uniref:type II toxin-antitoxin system VapC family toxin n=1 Tax=Tautonia marina TaxID=2653855 RepID=UPI0012606B0D|nr:PIN domain-containing protein [Tautonia marina]
MTTRFADTFFFLAIGNPRDAAHERSLAILANEPGPLLTTAWVLTELADALAAPGNRQAFLRLMERIRKNPSVEIVPPSPELFDRGLDLYARRPDKSWSLTDCISFVVMADRGLTEALTGDHHFEQAGFRAIFRSPT